MFSPKETSQKPNKSTAIFETKAIVTGLWHQCWALGCSGIASSQNSAAQPTAVTSAPSACTTKPHWHTTPALDPAKNNSRPRAAVSSASMLPGQSGSVMLQGEIIKCLWYILCLATCSSHKGGAAHNCKREWKGRQPSPHTKCIWECM